MILPTLPLDTTAKELVEFCLLFRSTAGFIGVYEENLSQLSVGKRKNKRRLSLKGKEESLERTAYEKTEQLYVELFSSRRYADWEVFKNTKYRFYREK